MQNRLLPLMLALFTIANLQSISFAASAARPNIVLILCDDLGYADVGFNGSKDIPTPTLDALAKQGTVFSSAYVVHPFCGPSRAALLTGRYPHEIGAQYNLPERGADDHEGIAVDETLVSKVLQDAGYFTGLVGKWHLGESSLFHPNQRGFNDFYGFLGGGHRYIPSQFVAEYEKQVKAGNKRIWSYLKPLEHNGSEVEVTEYLTDVLSQEGVRFINEAAEKDQPFFLYLSYNAPHTPLEAKEDDLKVVASIPDEKRRTYAAMVHAVDRGVNEVVQALKENNEFDNTLIVFLSDNGGRLDAGANNVPLRGGKGDTFEGGFRVPMFFHWPEVVPAGNRYEYPISALDFFPTFAHLAKASIPAEKSLAGKNIWDKLLAGENAREGEMIFALVHGLDDNDVGVRSDEWKLHRGEKRWKLYNVENDISEMHDLSHQHPERVQSMITAARKWSQGHVEPRWFHAQDVGKKWAENGMPNYDKTFSGD